MGKEPRGWGEEQRRGECGKTQARFFLIFFQRENNQNIFNFWPTPRNLFCKSKPRENTKSSDSDISGMKAHPSLPLFLQVDLVYCFPQPALPWHQHQFLEFRFRVGAACHCWESCGSCWASAPHRQPHLAGTLCERSLLPRWSSCCPWHRPAAGWTRPSRAPAIAAPLPPAAPRRWPWAAVQPEFCQWYWFPVSVVSAGRGVLAEVMVWTSIFLEI